MVAGICGTNQWIEDLPASLNSNSALKVNKFLKGEQARNPKDIFENSNYVKISMKINKNKLTLEMYTVENNKTERKKS